MKWLILGISVGMLLTLKWAEASEVYRCPDNVYQDTPAAGCTPVGDRISVVPSAHEQRERERAAIAAEREVIADTPSAPPALPLPTPAAPIYGFPYERHGETFCGSGYTRAC